MALRWLFLLLPLSSVAQPCYLCLTHEETLKAAEHTLRGEAAEDKLVVCQATKRHLEEENRLLLKALGTDSIADSLAVVKLDLCWKIGEEKVATVRKEGAKRTITWFVLAFLAGMAVNGF